MKSYTLGDGQDRSRRWLYLAVVLVLIAGYLYWTLGRPLPALQPTVGSASLTAQVPKGSLSWPAVGQSAVGVADSPILETHGTQKPTPTASTAKLITSLVVLQKKPLQVGQQGPTITLDANDVKLYTDTMSQDGSLVKVQAGERISEYQVLQTIMLPSANNMADSLAIWAFGSLKDYSSAANAYLKQHGINDTHVGNDASGLSPTTTSTASDLVKIGELAMRNPVLAEIVNQPTASGIPVVNNIKNVNQLLGTANIVGIKTGNTDQAGGVFVSGSHTTVNGKQVTIVTALANSPSLFQAMKDSLPLIRSAQGNFKPVTVAKQGSIVGNYTLPWGFSVPATAATDLNVKAWGGSTVTAKPQLREISASAKAGQTVGQATIPSSTTNNRISIPVKLDSTPKQPTTLWRLTHPF